MQARYKVISGLLLSFIGLRYGYYGFSVERAIQGCPYSYVIEPAPPRVRVSTIRLTEGAYIVDDDDWAEHCGPFKNATEGAIVTASAVRALGPTFPERPGVRPLGAGATFGVNLLVRMRKHGLETVDSGSSPMQMLVLEDELGQRFSLSTRDLTRQTLFVYGAEGTEERNVMDGPLGDLIVDAWNE